MLTEIEIERIRYDASRKVGGEFEDPDVFLLLDEVGRLREENKQLMTIAEDWQRQCVQALVERDKQRRVLEEARQYPRQPNGEGGWTIRNEFLAQVSDMTEDGEYCSMEQVENALLCAERLLGEGDKE